MLKLWLCGLAVLLASMMANADDRPVFAVTDYGADLSDNQPDDEAYSKCLQAAIEKGGTCRVGAGTLTLTMYPAELRQDGKLTKNRDLKGLVIEGVGEAETVVHGTSARGFDVFQLNGVENLTLRNLTITATKTTPDETQGVNGVSLTNGSAKVLIEHVTVKKLPFVVKPGRFDGGKAFTVQQGTLGAASSTDIEIRECQVFDTPIGFGIDADPNQPVLPGKIAVRNNRFERVSLGFSLSFAGKNSGGADVPGFALEIAGNTLTDVTRALIIGRAPDVVFRDNTITTKQRPDLPDPIIHPGIPIVIIGGPRGRFENNTLDYAPQTSSLVLIGGASGNVNSDKVIFTGNKFSGQATLGVQLLNAGITNSKFTGNTFAGVREEREKTLTDARLKNSWVAKKAKK